MTKGEVEPPPFCKQNLSLTFRPTPPSNRSNKFVTFGPNDEGQSLAGLQKIRETALVIRRLGLSFSDALREREILERDFRRHPLKIIYNFVKSPSVKSRKTLATIIKRLRVPPQVENPKSSRWVILLLGQRQTNVGRRRHRESLKTFWLFHFKVPFFPISQVHLEVEDKKTIYLNSLYQKF